MGKGDSKTRRGKIFKGSTGKHRPVKKSKNSVSIPDKKQVIEKTGDTEPKKAKAPAKKATPKKSLTKKTETKKVEAKKTTAKKSTAKSETKKTSEAKSNKAEK